MIPLIHFCNFHLQGTNVEVEKGDGTKIKGVFHTATPFAGMKNEYVLKAARVIKVGTTTSSRFSTSLLL
jgi:hypothetical protein